jgi:putative transposase
LAPQSFRVVLDAEITAACGKTERGGRNSQLDSAHEPSEPVVGTAPRIHGELRKLGIEVAQSTVAKYLHRPRKPSSETWRTFLTNHVEQMASLDFFLVPTATFRVLFVFVVLSHARRRVLHFQVTEHPSQEWTMQQMREAFPWDEAPRYVLRDRDAIYGRDFADLTRDMGMEEVLTAPRSPWQNPFAERLVGSIRRECLDHVAVWNERSLRRTLHNYFAYYQRSRTHLGLGKDSPEPRAVEPPERGCVVAILRSGDYTTDTSDAPLEEQAFPPTFRFGQKSERSAGRPLPS